MKKTLKKLLAGVLIAVLCVSSFAINASAATAQDSAVAANAEENEVAAAAVEEPVAAIDDNDEPLGRRSISDCDISVSLNSYEYDGTRKIVNVVVKYGDYTLKMGTDFSVGGPPIYSGTQPVIINGLDNFYGSVTKYVTVTKPIDRCDVSVTLNSYVYDGTPKKGTIVVKDGTKTLSMGTDYTVGGPPIYFGTMPVIIYGQGNYTGSVTKYVTVTKSIDRCDINVSLNSYVYDGTRKTVSVVINDGTKTLEMGKDFSVGGPPIYSGTQPVVINGMGNYTGTVTKYVTIQPVAIPASDISVTVSNVNGYLEPETNKVRNAVYVSVNYNGKTYNLTNGSGYTIEYTDYNITRVVSAKVTLTGGFTGTAYSGTFYPSSPSFIWRQDNFQFGNGGTPNGVVYHVDDVVFNSLANKFHLTEEEKTSLRNRIANDNTHSMYGRCAGMSNTCIMSKLGQIKLSDFTENDVALSNSAYENGQERTMLSVINFLQELWSPISCKKVEFDASGLFFNNKERFRPLQGSYIKKIANELEDGKTLLKLSYETETSSHAVVAYGVEPYQYHSEKTGKDYNYRILLYNPNFVLTNNTLFGETCIYFNKPESGNDNEYYYEMSGTDYYWSEDDQHYGGIFGAYKFYSLTDEQNILNSRYSKCFVDWVDGTVKYTYRIIVPQNGKKVLIGDANLDGKANIVDCTNMQRYLAEMDEYDDLQLVNADANLDGRIDVTDVTYLSRKIAGLIA